MTPDWRAIYEVSRHEYDRDNEPLTVTRETLRLASHALRKQNEDDYYHNYGAAEQEIIAALSLLSVRGDDPFRAPKQIGPFVFDHAEVPSGEHCSEGSPHCSKLVYLAKGAKHD
jgi:hypothetical protein